MRILLLFVLVLMTACNNSNSVPIPINKFKAVNITITGYNINRGGGYSYRYMLDDIPDKSFKINGSDECVDKSKIYVSSRLTVRMPLAKEPDTGSMVLIPITNICQMVALSTKLKVTKDENAAK